MAAKIFALSNQKGGVGKSTTTYNLARAAVLQGLRVLVVDADPQGNLTIITAKERVTAEDIDIADVLTARSDDTAADAIVSGLWDGLSVLPSSDKLALVRDELVTAGGGREARLREALAPIVNDYDLILIDCPPSLDLVTLNALAAADRVVIVANAGLFSAEGIAKLRGTIETVQRYYNPGLSIAGVIINAFEGNTLHDKHWLAELTANIQPILTPEIPKHTWIREASEGGVGLDELGTRAASRLAEVYAGYVDTIRES
jgi:chromosome partitioning protein